MMSPEQFNTRASDKLPGHLGIVITHGSEAEVVWDSVVKHRETGKTIALFRCTQMLLYAKGA